MRYLLPTRKSCILCQNIVYSKCYIDNQAVIVYVDLDVQIPDIMAPRVDKKGFEKSEDGYH